ncbi:MAG: hypothetical protein K1X88_22730 [Nannocystaceae bacterium]|nr:hypothetical protein [Nannocystaceae bacterium]
MVVLGAQRLTCPHCGRVQFHPLARRYRCRACGKSFAASAARGPAPRPPKSGTRRSGER